MKTTVANAHRIGCRTNNDVYIGRPSLWGNPFTNLGGKTLAKYVVSSKAECITAFEDWMLNSDDHDAAYIRKNIWQLQGKRLVCFCKPQPCHGDVLARLADTYPDWSTDCSN